MATNFKFYRIFCGTPPDLERERLAFESAVAQFVEQITMPDAVLFAPASLRPPIVAAAQKLTIESNIRTCEFFLQIFGEQWPGLVFPGFVEYALDGVGDLSRVTRKVGVLFRNYADAVPELREFRDRLAARGQCELRDFAGAEDLSQQLRELLLAWYASLKPETTG